MAFKLQFIVLLCFGIVLAEDQPCRAKSYGRETTVCVCNQEYCDKLKKLEKSAPGIVQTYTTSVDGDRFTYRQIKFNATKSSNDDDIHIKLLADQRMHKILGFGGSLTDSAAFNWHSLSDQLKDHMIKDYFSEDGIEYTNLRVSIGGSGMSTRKYSCDDYKEDDLNLSHFSLQQEDEQLKIPFIKNAQKVSPHSIKMIGTPWSPPAWMKTNHDLANGGSLRGKPYGDYYNAYARYLIRWLQDYRKNNVSFWGMTVQNEPTKHPYNSLEMTAEQQREFIKLALGPELKKAGSDFKNFQLMIYDWVIPGMEKYVETVLRDPEVAKVVKGIAYHSYGADDSNRGYLKRIRRKFPEQFILSTEAGEGYSGLGTWSTCEKYADDIIKSIRNFASGWMEWNMIGDTNGGPSWANQHPSASIVINASNHEYYKQPMFYTLGQFTKFLPPNTVYIQSKMDHDYNEDDDDEIYKDIQSIAFKRPDGGFVLIILNTSAQQKSFVVEDEKHGQFHTNVKGHSIVSYLWY